MICLDTNYLIRCLVPGTKEAQAVTSWLQAKVLLIAPSLVWYEFCCGPVGERETDLVRRVLTGGIIPFLEPHANEAARLFNKTGRKRHLRIDAAIAASAIVAGAEFASSNTNDFKEFVPFGLVLLD